MGLQISRPERPAEAYIQVKTVPYSANISIKFYFQHKKAYFYAETSKNHYL